MTPPLSERGEGRTGTQDRSGRSVLVNEISIKLIELLKEAAPKTERVAVFVNQTNPGAAPFLTDLMSVAPRLGIKVRPAEANTID